MRRLKRSISLPDEYEYAVSIENVDFRLLVSRENIKSEENIPLTLHNHVSAEIFAAIEGEIRIAIEGDNIVLHKGDIAVIPPKLRHSMLPFKGNSQVSVFSFICNKRNERNTDDLYSKLTACVSGNEPAVFRSVFPLCERSKEISEVSSGSYDKIKSIKAVLLLIELSLAQNGEIGEKISDDAERYDIQRMMKLDNLVGRYYNSDLKTSDIAAELYVSSRQLHRIALKRYGKTLRKVIIEKRVQAAERLLLTTDMSVERIGSEVGFSSAAGFYREFEAVYGLTPAKYRKNKKNIL